MDEYETKVTGVPQQPTPDEVVPNATQHEAVPQATTKTRCDLTGKPLLDGVVTQYNYVYERSALLEYLKDNDMMEMPIDPIMTADNGTDGDTFILTDCIDASVDEHGNEITKVDMSMLQDYDPDEKVQAAREAIPSVM
eukprot:COSAG01_NODE_43004_length_434_cov_0.773134_1_plen_137_part_01